MDKTKKILLIVFATLMIINLQLTGTLTSGMDNGFSLEQLADNIFVPSAYADEVGDKCADLGCPGGDYFCKEYTTSGGNIVWCMQQEQ